MENINGLILNKLDFTPSKQGDFIYHEGPLLSHFVDESNPNNQYFYKWTDASEERNRWMIFKFNEKQIKQFLNKEKTLLDIVYQNSFVYLLDLDNNLAEKQILLISVENIPASYLPAANSFFDEKQYEKYASNLRNKMITNNIDKNFKRVFKKIHLLRNEQKMNKRLLNLILENTHVKQA